MSGKWDLHSPEGVEESLCFSIDADREPTVANESPHDIYPSFIKPKPSQYPDKELPISYTFFHVDFDSNIASPVGSTNGEMISWTRRILSRFSLPLTKPICLIEMMRGRTAANLLASSFEKILLMKLHKLIGR